MRNDVITLMGNIERRLRGLKADRPVTIGQVAMLSVSQIFSVTLAGSASATFQVVVQCSDTPVVVGAIDGFPGSVLQIQPGNVLWSISGNTATGAFDVYNASGSTQSASINIQAWALNGLSATIARTS